MPIIVKRYFLEHINIEYKYDHIFFAWMKRRSESLKGPYRQERKGVENKRTKRSADAIDPVLRMLEETRKTRMKKMMTTEDVMEGRGGGGRKEKERERKEENKMEGPQEIKTKEDEEEVVALCRKIFEAHERCKVLSQKNQELLNEIESQMKLLKLSN